MIFVWLAAAAMLVLWSFSMFASPYEITYSGRLTSADGSPVQGPINLEVQFYHETSGGDGILIEPILFTNVQLSEGIFQIVLDHQKMTKNDYSRVFEGSLDTWIEVSNVSDVAPVIFPRQKFSTVPYALRIPTDEKSLIYNSEGKLKVGQLQSLILGSANSVKTATLKAAGSMDENVIYTLPPVPLAGSYLKTDSYGNLSWSAPSGSGDMQQSTYDTDGNGVVDNADKLGSQLPSFYQNAGNINSGSLVDERLSSNVMSGVNAANNATNLNTASTIIKRDSSGNFSVGSMTGSLIGNVTGNVSGSSSSFTGSLSGDVTGTQGGTTIATSAVTLAKIAPCADGKILKMSGVNWTCADDSNAGGTVTSVATGAGLTGVPITTTGTISLDDSGVVPGTFTKVTVDAKGRATTGALLVEADIPTLSTAGKVSGGAINSGTISGSAAINTSGSIVTTGTASSAGVTVTASGGATKEVHFNDADNSNYVGLKAADTITANKIWTLPTADGTNGQVLTTDGSGNLSWVAPGSAPVTSVNTLTGAVTLTSDNITEGSTNKYYTDARAKTAAVGDAITDAVTDKAPSQNAVYDALALKSDSSHSHSNATVGAAGFMSAADKTKLDAVEAGADVTDATNVAAAGAVMDGDFTSNGIMTRTGAGTYSSITDNSTNWNTAYGWGNHASVGYLTSVPWATPGTIGSTTPSTGVFTTVTGNTSLKLKDGDTNYATIKANNAMSADVTFTFPAGAGTDGQFLKTDGSGNLSWTDQSSAPVTSVNTLTGAVTLTSDNVSEGSTNKYYTDIRAKTAAVGDAIVDAVTDKAPSQNAVYDALVLKSDSSHNHTGVYEPAGLSANVVTHAKMATNSIGSDEIIDLTIATDDIATGAVTAAKIASCANGEILKMVGLNWTCTADTVGTVTSVTAAAPLASSGGVTPDISLSGQVPIANGGTGAANKTAGFDALSPLTTKGDVSVHNGTNNIRLGIGTNGQVLTSDSAQGSGVKWADPPSAPVSSVNTLTGAVTLTTTNIAEGTNLYYTDARAKAAAVGDAITDAVTDKAPSQNAVFDALALKSDSSHAHSNATVGAAGFMSAADKTKLDAVEAGADVTDATNVVAFQAQ